jgi:hypothetical protein
MLQCSSDRAQVSSWGASCGVGSCTYAGCVHVRALYTDELSRLKVCSVLLRHLFLHADDIASDTAAALCCCSACTCPTCNWLKHQSADVQHSVLLYCCSAAAPAPV